MGLQDATGFDPQKDDHDKSSKEVEHARTHPLMKALDEALVKGASLSARRVEALRTKRPTASTKELANQLERDFRQSVTVTGVATGASSAAPGVGTFVGLAAATGDMAWFITSAARYILALARLYDLDLEDIERQRVLVMTVLLGGSATGVATRAAETTGQHLGKKAVQQIPMQTVRSINKKLGPYFVTKFSQRGVIQLGKVLPFGFGAVIGGAGNYAVAHSTILSARKAFEEFE
ncbi:hypothetical protein KBX18_06560 [Corynebacterium sp. CCUG 69979]|uniref:hypothetical protein n=1 Tax=Corynebacterium sp. CCUG 69979 TaxID=2823890 RepID=UPI00210C6F6E|nr:hypothetical protein [Corynebacterium sp. CCUG 69979]MCQ4625220.1 hypothetical protein [Corynebacterium sp. CCUG 69979]